MKLYVGLTAGALLLAGCGKSEPSPPSPSTQAAQAAPEIPLMGPERRLLAFGDSMLSGYGLRTSESYPAKLEAALRARGIDARMSNAGVSGDTTADGLQRLGFTLKSQGPVPDVVIVSLGGNDMLRGLPPEQTEANLDAILTELGRRKIKVVLLGMLAPPNMGANYRAKFDPIYPALARKHGAILVPFFLQPVMGRPDLVQPDHIHPTVQGIEAIVAATVDQVAGALPSPAAPPRPR
jgi:acyl-CoA thioesterase-1